MEKGSIKSYFTRLSANERKALLEGIYNNLMRLISRLLNVRRFVEPFWTINKGVVLIAVILSM